MDANVKALPAAIFDPAALARQLADGKVIDGCKQAIATATDYLHQRFREGEQAGELIRLRAGFIDALLGALWENQDWDGSDLALVAVGGYGRGELHPHSDIDILILLGEQEQDCKPTLERFLTLLWDIGLVIGHSVRTVTECVRKAREDITILTNLMEARTLRGPEALMQRVRDLTGPQRMWPSPDFFRAKLEEQRERHTKFADTEYNLEPNVKSCPGGLRDLQIIGWLAERHFGVRSVEEITDSDFLDPEEMEIFTRGREFMWKVRYAPSARTRRTGA